MSFQTTDTKPEDSNYQSSTDMCLENLFDLDEELVVDEEAVFEFEAAVEAVEVVLRLRPLFLFCKVAEAEILLLEAVIEFFRVGFILFSEALRERG